MIFQCRTLALRTEQPALLQDRQHKLDEILEALVEIGRHDVEAAGGVLLEPELERVGDALGRVAKDSVATRGRGEIV
jgi:hypothetical protein